MFITDENTELLGLLGRNSWRRMAAELSEEEWFVMKMDGLFVPWRVSALDLTFAERYAGTEVYRLLSDEETEEGEADDLTWEDLVGFEVLDAQDDHTFVSLGTIEAVDETTMNTLLILDNGRMVPAHEDLILSLDMDTERLIMNLPSGL